MTKAKAVADESLSPAAPAATIPVGTAAGASQRRRDDELLGDNPGFIVTLEVAVPLWAQRWRGRPPEQQAARARSLGQFVACHGDRILYRTKGGPTRRLPAQEPDGGWQTCGRTHAPPDSIIPNPSSAECFNALAEGIALMSLLCPGGADVFGRHWHDGCRAAPAARWHPPLTPCVDLVAS